MFREDMLSLLKNCLVSLQYLVILNLPIEVESPSLAKADGPYGGDEVEGVKVGGPAFVGAVCQTQFPCV